MKRLSVSAAYRFWKMFDRTVLGMKKIVLGHILNPYIFNSGKARARRYSVYTVTVQKYIRKYYIDSVRDVPYTEAEKPAGREKVFTLWLQGEENAPALIRNCFDRMRKYCSDCDLVVLNQNNLTEYTDIPDYIWKKYRAGKIRRAHFSDICRLDLLYRYGGYWLDSTCFLTGTIPAFIRDSDFFAYMAGDRVKWNYSYIQNCFLHARKG